MSLVKKERGGKGQIRSAHLGKWQEERKEGKKKKGYHFFRKYVGFAILVEHKARDTAVELENRINSISIRNVVRQFEIPTGT